MANPERRITRYGIGELFGQNLEELTCWGKKTAVVIDLPFWNSLGEMTEVGNVSNCDIAWFVVNYEKNSETGQFALKEHSLHLTTLDRAVEGLTGGVPTSLTAFEEDIRKRLKATLQ